MCRLAAIISEKKISTSSRVSEMIQSMYRGGPDDSGIFEDIDNSVCFGHRRLSILDLSDEGHQPMADLDKNYFIIFNGEIYNYLSIKANLVSKGYVFRSNSDTEVLLNGYKEWGVKVFEKIEGMFAFIIYDKLKKEIIACRDQEGIKPLYYSQIGDELFFSSEIRALLRINPNWPNNPEWTTLFLAFGFIPEPYTKLKDVFQLPKASYLKFNLTSKKILIQEYHKEHFSENISDRNFIISSIRSILEKSIKSHLISDVPTGVFLSGGLDSTIITTLAQKFQKHKLKTLSIYFDDEKYNEKYYQDLVIRRTGVEHHQFKVTNNDYIDFFPDFLNAMDQPTVDGINTYFISKYSKEIGLKVVLSGLGADEIFGGYPSFDNKFDFIKKQKTLLKIFSFFVDSYPFKKIEFLDENRWYNDYLLSRSLFAPSDISKITGIDLPSIQNILSKISKPSSFENFSKFNRTSFFEKNIYMQNQLLRDSDVFSMWHGVEIRVPFLDLSLVNFMQNVSSDIKNGNNQKKILLIDAFKDDIDEAIWNRKKMGFTFPFESWRQPIELSSFSEYWDKKFLSKEINYSRYYMLNLIKKHI